MKKTDLIITEFEDALLQIDRVKAREIFEDLYIEQKSIEIIESVVMGTLEKIGNGWEIGEISLSQVYMSGVICEELIEEYLPKFDMKRVDIPKMAIAVLQDHHALGKRIVYSVLRAGGFELMDFGQGLSIDELVQKTIENNIEILLISTLMLASALKVKEVKEKLSASGCKTKIIVGGAPFRLDRSLWKSVGADADGKSATNIINEVEILLKE